MEVEKFIWTIFFGGLVVFGLYNSIFTPPDARGTVYIILIIAAVLGLFKVGLSKPRNS